MAGALLIGALVAQGVSGMMEADALEQNAVDQRAILEVQARSDEIKANEELAQGVQEGQEFKRRKDLALSRLQARAAASGFSATDPSTLQLEEDIEERGSVQQGLAIFGGLSRQSALRDSASSRRAQGSAGVKAARRARVPTILGTAGSMARFALNNKDSFDFGGRRSDFSGPFGSGF